MTSPEYQRGYRAGRACSTKHTNTRVAAAREAFIQELVIAIAPCMIASPWQTSGKTWASAAEFADGIRNVAQTIANRQFFRTLIEGQ